MTKECEIIYMGTSVLCMSNVLSVEPWGVSILDVSSFCDFKQYTRFSFDVEYVSVVFISQTRKINQSEKIGTKMQHLSKQTH